MMVNVGKYIKVCQFYEWLAMWLDYVNMAQCRMQIRQ
jgi:hypothetical protein